MNLKSKVRQADILQRDYSREDLNKAFRILNDLIENVFNPGDLVASSLQFVPINGVTTLAPSGYGLPIGGVYYDDNGFLKIVRPSDIFAPSFTTRVKLGTVTVTT